MGDRSDAGATSRSRRRDIEPIPEDTDRVAKTVLDAAFAVHTALGPGLLESVYEICLAHECKKRGLEVVRQVVVPVLYDGVRIESGLRLDLLVDDRVIVELKAVDALIPIHEAQVITYLKLTGKRLALLLNFNVMHLKEGIKRIAL